MASLAAQAGYQSLRVLRGPEATRQALRDELEAAAEGLREGDILFISFSGHGSQERDGDGDDGGWDECWCLHDGIILDDELADWWRRFEPGVRILVVAEACFGAGGGRDAEGWPRVAKRPARPVYRATLAMRPPGDAEGIRASVLLLAACGEQQHARDGLFTHHLVELWSDGAFAGSYRDLLQLLRQQLLPVQNPELRMHGAEDVGFADETAFHLMQQSTACRPVAQLLREPPAASRPRGSRMRGA
jgi:hypothetical protein